MFRHRHKGQFFAWCALALVGLAAGIYFGPQTVEYWRLRPLLFGLSDGPLRGWSSVPRPLDDTSLSTAEGSILSYYGYRFEVPWKDIDWEHDDGPIAEVGFKTRQTVTFLNPIRYQENPIGGAFASGIHESKYEQYKAVISTTPSQWSPFRSHKKFAQVRTLLDIKGMWIENYGPTADIFII